MMAAADLPDIGLLLAVLDYNPDTGALIWKERPSSMFSAGFRTSEHNAAIWNSKNAGEGFGQLTPKGYLRGSILGRRVMAHRVAWKIAYGVAPADEIDHINGVRSDNRLANLREADRHGNCRNRVAASNSTSLHIGVSWNAKMMMWRAQIAVNSRNTHLGYFASEDEAAATYRIAARQHFGEFHRAATEAANGLSDH